MLTATQKSMKGSFFLFMIILSMIAIAGCGKDAEIAEPTPPPLAEELIFYDWPEDPIETVFDAFTEEYGVKIRVMAFESTEQAVENMRAGEVYDIVVMENQYVPVLVEEDLLAKIDYQNVPNFKNISPSFRNLAYDPDNMHAIPYSWGTTGLVVRTDLVEEPVTRWADMWDERYAGHIANWDSTPRFMIGAALKILGYSINSEDPAELEEALDLLLELKPNATWVSEDIVSGFIDGEYVMAQGWSEDFWYAQEEIDDIAYVLPEEGTILWGDNFVIPANSPSKYTAELFLNFLLRAEISGEIVNEIYYPMPNDAAVEFIDPELLNDPAVYPTNEELKNAEILMPLSPEGEALFVDIWDRFMVSEG